MTIDEQLAREGADWIAEMVTEELGGFIPSELVDFVMEHEADIREQRGDPEMDHETMAGELLPRFEEEGLPVNEQGGISKHVLVEILHWEDEFLAMAGQPRVVRPS